ncbi:MAG: RidA family protein [Myxococcota bacterium]
MAHAIRHDPYPVDSTYRGIYAHGVETAPGGRMLHVSGQVGVAPSGDLPVDFEGQCRQALKNLEAVLAAASMSFRDIVKMSFFLVDRGDMGALVRVRKSLLDGVRPAITTVFVAGLVNPNWRVEVEAVAARPEQI